jgi:DNA-binding NarL/FixJ family response regulator
MIRDCTAQSRQPAGESTKAGAKLIEGKFAPPQIFRRNRDGLTFRELTVLNLLAAGTTDKEIADKLCLSIYTVNKHVANILGKMQATSRTEAAVRAAREGLATISA